MNIANKIKLNFYSELKELNIEDEILKQILSNRNFKTHYKTNIKPFIKYLREYKYSEYDNGTLKQVGLDENTIKQHLKAVFELSIKNNSNKYISFISKKHYEKTKITNFNIFNDSNFEILYSMIGYEVFNDNISKIISNGNSNKLIEFINNNGEMNLTKINLSMFDDKVWNIINQNPSIGNTTALKLFNSKMDTLVDLINKDLFEGIKYTYENIPESHNFIEHQLGTKKEGTLSFQQFSMDFIKNIGNETLKKLYACNKFLNEAEFKKIFEITSRGNYELIQDIVNYDTYDFNFENISSNDMQKQLLETNINHYNKNEVFLNKYFGIERKDVHYIKLFLNAINKANNLPDEFKNKYGNILQLLNQILISTDEELIKISKTVNLDKKEGYKKLIETCEKEGNEVLKNQFVDDLKIKNQQIVSTAEHKKIITNDGKTINVYELSGQPFTMLVHAVVDNRMSINNSYVSQIVNNPKEWDKINGGNNHISTSLISDKYMVTYGIPNKNDTIMFGFNDLPCDAVKFTDVADVGIDRKASTDMNYNMRNRLFVARINTVTTIDDLMEKTIETNLRKPPNSRLWNEIGLSRTDETTGIKIKPNFVVCMDTISESSIKAAQQFNIPIYLINRKYYQELPYINENNNELEATQMLETGHLKR